MNNFKMIKWNSNVNSIILLLLGLLLLLFPIESLNIGGYLIASILMILGIGHIIKLIQNKGIENNGDILYLILSISFIILSITIFIDPTWIIRTINILVGVLLLITSTMNFISLLKYTKNRTTSWWIYTILVALVFISGIVIIINPLFLAKIITRIEGSVLVINSLITLLLTKKVGKTLLIEEKTI